MRVSRASMIPSLGRIGPFIQGRISCIRRRFSSRRVVHERDTRSNVCCAIGSLLFPFHHKKLRCLAQQEKAAFRIQVLLPSVRSSFFDQSRNFLRPGGVDRVARALDFDLVTLGSFGVPPFEVRVDGSVFCRYQHPARFASPRRRGDDRFEIVSCVEHLRSSHESGLLSWQVGCEVLMKLRGVEVSETVSRLLYCSRLAEVTWEAFSVVRLILSSVWHVSRDVNQSGNRWIRARFGNYGSPVAVSDKNARSILLSKDALGGSHIIFKGRLRFLDDADIVAILDEKVVNALPARTICPGTVNQYNIPNAMLCVLR